MKNDYGLKVLTVTSRPPLESEIGKRNLIQFVNSGFDHIHITPNQNAMKKYTELLQTCYQSN